MADQRGAVENNDDDQDSKILIIDDNMSNIEALSHLLL